MESVNLTADISNTSLRRTPGLANQRAGGARTTTLGGSPTNSATSLSPQQYTRHSDDAHKFADIDAVDDDSTNELFVSQGSGRPFTTPSWCSRTNWNDERAEPELCPSSNGHAPEFARISFIPGDNDYRTSGDGYVLPPSSSNFRRLPPSIGPQHQLRQSQQSEDADDSAIFRPPPTPSSRQKRARYDEAEEVDDVRYIPRKRTRTAGANSTPSRSSRSSASSSALPPSITPPLRDRTQQRPTRPTSLDASATLADLTNTENRIEALLSLSGPVMVLFRDMTNQITTFRTRVEKAEAETRDLRTHVDLIFESFAAETTKVIKETNAKCQEVIDSNDEKMAAATMRVGGGPYGGPKFSRPNNPPSVFAGLFGNNEVGGAAGS